MPYFSFLISYLLHPVSGTLFPVVCMYTHALVYGSSMYSWRPTLGIFFPFHLASLLSISCSPLCSWYELPGVFLCVYVRPDSYFFSLAGEGLGRLDDIFGIHKGMSSCKSGCHQVLGELNLDSPPTSVWFLEELNSHWLC